MVEISADIAAATARQPRGSQMWKDTRILGLLSVMIGLGLWELGASSFSALVLPPPSAVFARFLDPTFLPRLLSALGYSLGALAAGFSLALALAVPLGVVLGRSPVLHRMFDPLINAIYAIPPVAFVPFLIIWFGLFFEGRVALVFMMCFFDMLVVVIAGSRDVRRSLIDVGRSFGAGRGQCMRLIVLPALMPFLFAALRVGSARAINGMITAELFFAAANLGQIMKRSTQAFDTASAMAVVITICLLGLIAQTAIQLLERRMLSWHQRT